MKTQKIDVWYWGDDIDEAGKNIERYVQMRWNEKIKEAEILVEGWFQDEGALFDLFAYTGDIRKWDALLSPPLTSVMELRMSKWIA